MALTTHTRGLMTSSVAAALLLAVSAEARVPAFLHFHAPATTTTTTTTIITTETTLYHGTNADDLATAAGSALEDSTALLTRAADISNSITGMDDPLAQRAGRMAGTVHGQGGILASLEGPLPEDLESDLLEEAERLEDLGAFDDSADAYDLQLDPLHDIFALEDSVPFDLEIVDVSSSQNNDNMVQEYQSEGLSITEEQSNSLTGKDEEMLKVYEALDMLNAGEVFEGGSDSQQDEDVADMEEIQGLVKGFKAVVSEKVTKGALQVAEVLQHLADGSGKGLQRLLDLATELIAHVIWLDKTDCYKEWLVVGKTEEVLREKVQELTFQRASDHIMRPLESFFGKVAGRK